MRSSCKVNLVGVDGLLRLDGSHGNYVNNNNNKTSAVKFKENNNNKIDNA